MFEFEKGALIRTPTGRRAHVLYYDHEQRVHVRYLNGINCNEQATFPGRLLTQFSRIPEEESYPKPDTHVAPDKPSDYTASTIYSPFDRLGRRKSPFTKDES